ncbi:MAG: anti-sigma factor, partial [Pseudomonadota bacterium]
MSDQRFSDETLMAFADGELSPQEYASVEQAMAADTELAARVTAFIESRTVAQGALAPLLDEPVPDELAGKISAMLDEPSNVVDFTPPQTRALPRKWALPIAASIALVAGGVGGYLTGVSSIQQPVEVALDAVNQPAIVAALNSVASGEERDL